MKEPLYGNDVQQCATKSVDELVPEVWSAVIRTAVASVYSEVVNHGSQIFTTARIGMSYRSVGPERIDDRTADGVRALVREHLEALVQPLEELAV